MAQARFRLPARYFVFAAGCLVGAILGSWVMFLLNPELFKTESGHTPADFARNIFSVVSGIVLVTFGTFCGACIAGGLTYVLVRNGRDDGQGQARKDRRAYTAILVISWIVVLFGCFVLAALKSEKAGAEWRAQSGWQSSDVDRILDAYGSFQKAHGSPPRKKEDLKSDHLYRWIHFRDFTIFWNVDILGMQGRKPRIKNAIVVYQKDVPTRGGWVGFGDGSVMEVSAEQFAKLPKAVSK